MIGYYALEEGGGAAFDADYQAVLDELTSLGYTLPSPAQQILQNALVVDLKADGGWGELDTLYVIANDASLNTGRLNFINPTANALTDGGSPSWVSNEGFVGGATNGTRLFTNYQPSVDGTNFVLDDASYGFWFHSMGSSGDYLFGDFARNLLRNNGNTTRISSAASTTITTPTAGYFAIKRDNGLDFDVNDDGSVSNYSATSASVDDNDFVLLNRHGQNVASDATMSIHFCGSALAADNCEAAITTYMNAI